MMTREPGDRPARVALAGLKDWPGAIDTRLSDDRAAGTAADWLASAMRPLAILSGRDRGCPRRMLFDAWIDVMTKFQIPLFAAAVLSAVPAAHAQDSTADDPTILVTASRSGDALAASQLGGSVTVIDAETLGNRQVRQLADVLRDVPGIAVSQIPGQTQLRLRGAEGNHVLALIDGIEVSDSFSGEFDFGTLLSDGSARVEVLRGQQSALYGSDAIGGVINYITLSGREDPGFTARIEGGSFSSVNGAARLAGLAGDIDYALSATFLSTDGTPNARIGSRHLGLDSGALSLKTSWQAAANLTLTAVGRYAFSDGDANASDPDPDSPTFGFIIDTPGNRFENEAFYGLLEARLNLLDDRWTHLASIQFADNERDNFSFDSRTSGNEGHRLKASYVSALRLGNEDLQHHLTLAIDGERERFRNTTPGGFAFTGRRQITNLGLVGQYDLNIGDHASVSGALRRDINSRFQDSTTYRVQGSYRFDSGTRLRAAAGSGVKNPGFFELFGFVDGRFIGNAALRPEKSQGWEIGIEQSLAGERLLIGATYFDSALENEIFTDSPPPDFTPTPRNRTTRSKRHGVETFLTARPARGWRIDAAYTYLRARENGVKEVRRPNHVASLAIDWRASDEISGLNLVARYTGDQIDSAFTNPNFIPVRAELDSFSLVNLGGDLALSDRFILFGRIDNLFAEDYEQVFSFRNPGRAAYAGIRARF